MKKLWILFVLSVCTTIYAHAQDGNGKLNISTENVEFTAHEKIKPFILSGNPTEIESEILDLFARIGEQNTKKLFLAPNHELLNPRQEYTPLKLDPVIPAVFFAVYNMYGALTNYCSAALIHPRLALTAKHCLRNKNSAIGVIYKMDQLKGNPGYSKVKTVREICQSSKWCENKGNGSFFIPLGDVKNPNFTGDDIVLLELETDIVSEQGYFTLDNEIETTSDQKLQLAGYPQDLTSPETGYPDKYVSKEVCSYLGEFSNIVYSNCIPSGGISGGPLFYGRDGQLKLVGILSTEIFIRIENKTSAQVLHGSRYVSLKKMRSLINQTIAEFNKSQGPAR